MALEKVGTFVLTDESLDADSERIIAEGIDLTRFEANPVMLYNHIRSVSSWFSNTPDTRSILPIGNWQNIRKQRKRIVADAYIDFDDEFAAKVGNKVRNGIINAVSIGFRPLAWSDAPDDMVKGQTGLTVTKSELWEASLVDVPSNPNAVAISKSVGMPEAETKAINPNGIFIKTFHKISDADAADLLTPKNNLTMANSLFDTVKATVKSLFGKDVENEEQAIKALQEAENIKAETLDIQAVKNALSADFEAVRGDVTKVAADFTAALETARNEFKAAITERDNAISALTDKVATMGVEKEEQTEEVKAEIDAAAESIKALNAKIASLQSGKSGKQTTVEAAAIQTTDTNTGQNVVSNTITSAKSATEMVMNGDSYKRMKFNR